MNLSNVFFQSFNEELPYFMPSTTFENHSADHDLSVDVPLDMLTMFEICDILDDARYLSKLTLSAPAELTHFVENREEILETLVWFLRKTSDLKHLERVAMTLDMPETELILTLFQCLPRLRVLELQMPTSFDYNSQHEGVRRRLMNGVEFAIEGFQQLEEIVISTDLVTGTFAELLDRMFDSKTTLTGSRIRYSNRARNLLYVPTT